LENEQSTSTYHYHQTPLSEKHKKRVVPVVMPVTPDTTSTASTKPTNASPAVTPRVSAATMRQIQSRHRVRAAMAAATSAKKPKKLRAHPAAAVTPSPSGRSSANEVQTRSRDENQPVCDQAIAPSSSRIVSPSKSGSLTPPKKLFSSKDKHQSATKTLPVVTTNETTPTAASRMASTSVPSPPPSVIAYQQPLIRFKVKSTTTSTVLRFQCDPTHDSVVDNVARRLGGGGAANTSNSCSNSDDNRKKFKLQYQDADDD